MNIRGMDSNVDVVKFESDERDYRNEYQGQARGHGFFRGGFTRGGVPRKRPGNETTRTVQCCMWIRFQRPNSWSGTPFPSFYFDTTLITLHYNNVPRYRHTSVVVPEWQGHAPQSLPVGALAEAGRAGSSPWPWNTAWVSLQKGSWEVDWLSPPFLSFFLSSVHPSLFPYHVTMVPCYLPTNPAEFNSVQLGTQTKHSAIIFFLLVPYITPCSTSQRILLTIAPIPPTFLGGSRTSGMPCLAYSQHPYLTQPRPRPRPRP